MDVQEERQLVRRAKKDPESFGKLFDHYYQQIYAFILKRTGNTETAKDLTSETFYQALKSIWRFTITNKPFSAWLYRIAVVQIAQYYRQKEKYCEITTDLAPELVAAEDYKPDFSILQEHDNVEQLKAFEDLHETLLQLSEIQHTVIVLRYFEEKKIKEIAQIMGLKENTVKSHIRRALKKLYSLVQKSETQSLTDYAGEKFTQFRKMLAENIA
jgi:RNA polymerase sigma-70 factor (ECF subfamily)